MRAMVLVSPAPIETAPLQPLDVPTPDPAPGEVRVRVLACGICRTDLHIVEGAPPWRGASSPAIRSWASSTRRARR